MLSSPSNTDHVSLWPRRRDLSTSPVRRAATDHRTPPRFMPKSSRNQSPMRSSSPLKRMPMPVDSMDEDDVFSSPMPASFRLGDHKENTSRRRSNLFAMDEDDALFLPPTSPAHSRTLFPPSSSPMPLRTPVKSSSNMFETPVRPVFSVASTNSPFVTTAAAGTKRKPAPAAFSTPDRRCMLTPLNVTASRAVSDVGDGESSAFERLAPLPAPSFTVRTPQTRADAEAHLKHQTDSMRRLKIKDRNMSGEESGYDSGAEAQQERGKPVYAGGAPPSTIKSRKSPGLALLIRKGVQNDDEVIESMSPGGHVNKRRARSRPVSAELLAATPAPRTAEVRLAFFITFALLTHEIGHVVSNPGSECRSDPRSNRISISRHSPRPPQLEFVHELSGGWVTTSAVSTNVRCCLSCIVATQAGSIEPPHKCQLRDLVLWPINTSTAVTNEEI